jgi:S-methylmethionine-dependent homocysteine/selenocysteine methylase
MTKSIKILYEDWSLSAGSVFATGNIFASKIKEAIVNFDGNNTPYVDSMSYSDNFDCFVHDAFSSGFVYINDRKAISILQIKCFEFNDVVEVINVECAKETTSKNVIPQPASSNNLNRKSNKRKIRKQRKPIEKKNIVNDGDKNEG